MDNDVVLIQYIILDREKRELERQKTETYYFIGIGLKPNVQFICVKH